MSEEEGSRERRDQDETPSGVRRRIHPRFHRRNGGAGRGDRERRGEDRRGGRRGGVEGGGEEAEPGGRRGDPGQTEADED